MGPIAPGDFVEQIRSYVGPGNVGRVFRVDTVEIAVGFFPHGNDCTATLALTFVGQPLPKRGPGYCACAYRPLYRPSEEFKRQCLEPVPAAVHEKAR